MFKKGMNLVGIEVIDYATGGSLERDAENMLCLIEVFRKFPAEKLKETVDGTESNVTSCRAIMAFGFETFEKRTDRGEIEALYRQVTNSSALAGGKL